MTLLILLFSVGFLTLLTVLLQLKKIRELIFIALVAMLLVFDFALLSLDKIYWLHQQQDRQHEQVLLDHEAKMSQQVAMYRLLTKTQLDMTLQLVTHSTPQENEASIRQKLQWRDAMQRQLTAIDFDAAAIEQVKIKIDRLAHRYLMEDLNQQLRQSMGHRNYSEFVRSRPRQQWTDELFMKEVEAFLNKENLMQANIELALGRVRAFDRSGELMLR
ncbi:MAG: hypothetical protein RPR98_00380 [Bermanella sp.]